MLTRIAARFILAGVKAVLGWLWEVFTGPFEPKCDVCGKPWAPGGFRLIQGGKARTFCAEHKEGRS